MRVLYHNVYSALTPACPEISSRHHNHASLAYPAVSSVQIGGVRGLFSVFSSSFRYPVSESNLCEAEYQNPARR